MWSFWSVKISDRAASGIDEADVERLTTDETLIYIALNKIYSTCIIMIIIMLIIIVLCCHIVPLLVPWVGKTRETRVDLYFALPLPRGFHHFCGVQQGGAARLFRGAGNIGNFPSAGRGVHPWHPRPMIGTANRKKTEACLLRASLSPSLLLWGLGDNSGIWKQDLMFLPPIGYVCGWRSKHLEWRNNLFCRLQFHLSDVARKPPLFQCLKR